MTRFVFCVCAVLLFTYHTPTSFAATLTVDGTNCTLVDAIQSTNNNTDTGTCSSGDGEVVGSYGNDTVLISNNITVTTIYSGTTGLPPITDNLIIQSDQAGVQRTISRSSGSNFRIFSVVGKTVHFEDLVIENGRVAAFSGGGAGIQIQSGSTVTIDSVTLRNNTSTGTFSTSGGGLHTTSSIVTITDSSIVNNTSASGGAGISQAGGTLEIYNSEINNNTNTGTVGGSALLLQQSGSGTSEAFVYNSDLSENSGKTVIYTLGVFGSFYLTIENTTINDNTGAGDLALVNTVANINESTIDANESTSNSLIGIITAGLSIKNSEVTLENSTISNNTGTNYAGIYIVGDSQVVLLNNTISGNEADTGAGVIINRGHDSLNKTIDIIHVTITENEGDHAGLAIHGEEDDESLVTISNSIVANNDGVISENCSLNDYGFSGGAVLVSDGGTIFGDLSVDINQTTSCLSSIDLLEDVYGIVDPGLENLDDNNGTTQTHALKEASIAIDFVVNEITNNDQRGISRPQDGNGDAIAKSDAGAYESGTVSLPPQCTGSRCVPTLPRFGCKDPNADPFLSMNFIPMNDPRYGFYFHYRGFCAYTYFGFTIEPLPTTPNEEDGEMTNPDDIEKEGTPIDPLVPTIPPPIPTGGCVPFTGALRPKTKITTKEIQNEVLLWQSFLLTQNIEPITMNGLYDDATVQAVKNFQKKYGNVVLLPWTVTPSKISYEKTKNGTGYIYKTTRAVANYIKGCGTESVFIEDANITIDIKTEMQKYYPETIPATLSDESGEHVTVEE